MLTMPSVRRQAGISTVVVLLIVLIVLVVAGGTGAALYVAGVFGGQEAIAADGTPVPEPKKPPIYVPLDPPLVVNFERNGRMGFLQATIQVMTREAAVQEALGQHTPVIRNNLLMLLSSKTYADVASREGKEALRHEALAEVNRVLAEQQVEGMVEDLYFTGFVMQ